MGLFARVCRWGLSVLAFIFVARVWLVKKVECPRFFSRFFYFYRSKSLSVLVAGAGSRGKAKHAGFTLIELVVAVAIFSFVALAANQVLSNVTSSSEISDAELSNLQSLQRAMLVIERDFQQITDRVPRIQGQENKLVLNGGEFEFESDADGIAMVRSGWHNPQMMLPRSELQNVVYRMQEGQLQRLHTNFVDAVIGTEPKLRVLLDDIEDFQVEVLRTVSSNEEFEWSDTIESTELPKAIQITITSTQFGELRRVFQVSL
ncbi:type II secretion system minor pseudopilin GspJ [Glaciecola siphonariae]|uniref:Type II secretion system protein J n=1 Tax=Glaciecola siphonariae TaxID=521012 RepID=A0ABV9LQ44_9ALTE